LTVFEKRDTIVHKRTSGGEIVADKKLLTVEEVSQRLSIPEKTVRDYLRSGKLRGSKIGAGRLWRIPEDEIARHLRKETAKRPVEGMETISFVSVKGGVGKSVSAIVTAFLISEKEKVLLIDLDPQNAITSHFIEDIGSIQNKTVRQVLKGEMAIQDCIIHISENLDLLPSEIELALLDKELAYQNTAVFLLHDALELVRTEYKYCIVDTPPNMSLNTQIGIVASDTVVIPTQLESWSVRGISATMQEIEDSEKAQKYIRKQISRILILPTFYEENRVVKSTYLQSLKQNYTDYVTRTIIHSASEIQKTFAMPGENISNNTRAYEEYRDFVNELKGA